MSFAIHVRVGKTVCFPPTGQASRLDRSLASKRATSHRCPHQLCCFVLGGVGCGSCPKKCKLVTNIEDQDPRSYSRRVQLNRGAGLFIFCSGRHAANYACHREAPVRDDCENRERVEGEYSKQVASFRKALHSPLSPCVQVCILCCVFVLSPPSWPCSGVAGSPAQKRLETPLKAQPIFCLMQKCKSNIWTISRRRLAA